jgi:hypothetical protein
VVGFDMADSGGKEMKEIVETGVKIAKDLGLDKVAISVMKFMQKRCDSQVLKNGMGSMVPDATPSLGVGKSQGIGK